MNLARKTVAGHLCPAMLKKRNQFTCRKCLSLLGAISHGLGYLDIYVVAVGRWKWDLIAYRCLLSEWAFSGTLMGFFSVGLHRLIFFYLPELMRNWNIANCTDWMKFSSAGVDFYALLFLVQPNDFFHIYRKLIFRERFEDSGKLIRFSLALKFYLKPTQSFVYGSLFYKSDTSSIWLTLFIWILYGKLQYVSEDFRFFLIVSIIQAIEN